MAKKRTKKKTTPCWDTHTNIVNGKQTFKKKGGKKVPDCKPINGKK